MRLALDLVLSKLVTLSGVYENLKYQHCFQRTQRGFRLMYIWQTTDGDSEPLVRACCQLSAVEQ